MEVKWLTTMMQRTRQRIFINMSICMYVYICLYNDMNKLKKKEGKNWAEYIEIFHIFIPPTTCIISSIINIPNQPGIFVAINESMLTCHDHPNFILYIRVCSWCIVCGLGHIIMTCIHFYSVLQSSTVLSSLILPPNPWKPLIFHCLHSFAFSRRSCSCNHIVCSLFKMAFLLCKIHWSFIHVSL